ncbi:MAG: SAM-dependent methyltransferase, partial [Chloroflexi bacterium]|nr:SAM-dependent methyltransferase [Chloroflexota bacterium]
MAVDERTFNADVVGWINEILGQRPDLPFSRAAFEEHGITGRRDFTIYARSPRLRKVLTGELKVPDKPYGKSAYDLNLVSDAQKKANELGVSFFFTWNVNQLVLWRTFAENTPIDQRDLEHFEVASLRSSDQLNHEATREQMKDFVRSFLERFTEILQGSEPIRNRPPDEKFIRIIESALASPILDTQDALDAKYFADAGFRTNLGAWMRDVQGWTLSDIPEIQRQ